jgi:hypothetical protein
VAGSDQILPGLGARKDRPRLNPGADLTAHRLTPVEGFVLSRVDGTLSYDEICLVTGLGEESTLGILRRLRSEGLIIGPGDPLPAPSPPPRSTPVVGAAVRRTTPERSSLLEKLDDGSPVSPAEVEAGGDLPVEMKTRIVRFHRRLKQLGPYEIFGLERGADRAAVKRAYYAASKELHPDRYFGKDLGPFREMLGDIFARLTEAFQAIDDKK